MKNRARGLEKGKNQRKIMKKKSGHMKRENKKGKGERKVINEKNKRKIEKRHGFKMIRH